MDKGFKNITNLTPKAQADRIKQIQQKLQLITETKTNQAREQKVSNSNIRVSNIERNSSQIIRKFENQLRQQKQTLKELGREYEENRSKQQISLRNRITEINQLQNRFTCVLKAELQKTKESQKKTIAHFQQRLEIMRLMIAKQVQKRKQYFLVLDQTLSDRLPSLQAEVTQKIQQSSRNLDRIQHQIQTETQHICKQIQEAQTKQLQSFEELMKMMGSVIAQIKQEIGLEKQSRQASKKKLLSLFEGAYGKLSC